MCTVTFIPAGDRVIITSNRDEKTARKKAIFPEVLQLGQTKILFPKDAQAGGTWIGIADTGTVMVLLNGGFIKHEPAAFYRKSRGLIFLDILAEAKALAAFKKIPLLGIEPFTLVIWEDGSLHECRWSGEEKYIRFMDMMQPHIWSSVTLYTSDIIHKREQWFREWMEKYPSPTAEDMIRFHLFGGDGDTENDIRMNRNNTMVTLSITNIVCDNAAAVMLYHDMITQEKYFSSLSFVQQQPVS